MAIFAVIILWQVNLTGWIPNTILLAALIVLAWINFRRAGWQGAAGALKEELAVVRARCERLEDQNTALTRDNSDLRAKVDLTPIQNGLASLSVLVGNQYTETTKILTEITRVLVGIQGRLSAFAVDELPPRDRSMHGPRKHE